MKPANMWLAKHPNGTLELATISFTKHQAVCDIVSLESFCGNPPTWPSLYRKGWRVVKVEVREVLDNPATKEGE